MKDSFVSWELCQGGGFGSYRFVPDPAVGKPKMVCFFKSCVFFSSLVYGCFI